MEEINKGRILRMKVKKFKKIISLLLVVVLLMTILSGCSSRNGKDNKQAINADNNEIPMGRYVEQDFEYPEGVGAENYICLLKNPEGNLELYSYIINKQNEAVSYAKHVQKDGVWTEDNAEGLNNKVLTDKLAFINRVFYGENGIQYLKCDDAEYHTVLYKLLDNGEYEKITIPKFQEEYKDWGISYKPSALEVLKNGMIAAMYYQGEIEVYSSDGQTMINELDSGKSMEIEGNKLYYTSQNGNELLVYNLETKQQEPLRKSYTEISNVSIMDIDNGAAYICDSAGIHKNLEGSSIWETIVDGELNSLSAPSYTIQNIVVGATDDYYVEMRDIDFKVSLMHYIYDKNVTSVPSKELVIYSLKDSNAIRQAMVTFQKNNPDVFVTFRVADTDEGATTTADYIIALNTELLAKKGADILVLDGLPIDSYIEKGVLEDMGSIFTPRVESEELISNIANNYIEDGKVFAMPLRFTMPIIYGNADAVKAAASLEKLADYTQNTDTPLLTPSNYRALAEWFLLMNYNKIVNEKNEFDEKLFQQLLENVNKIAVNISADDDAELNQMNTLKGMRTGYWIASIFDVGKKLVQTNIEEVGSLRDIQAPLTVLKELKGTYSSFNNMYRANSLIGINSAGSQKELAKEFIQLLFTEEMQKIILGEGFPINKKALEEWRQKDDNYVSSISSGKGDYTINANAPNQEERNELIEKLYSLTTPIVNDTKIIDMILDEAEKYLKGDITAEQAAKNASSNVKTYLAE